MQTDSKRCSRCGEIKPVEAFGRRGNRSGGRLSRCKACRHADYMENREAVLATSRRYHEANRGRWWRRHRQSNPQAHAAQVALYKAVKKGRVTRPDSCQACGIECKPDAHHWDYSRPLSVVWVCRSCHMRHHNGANNIVVVTPKAILLIR